jgi:hypothetical protein
MREHRGLFFCIFKVNLCKICRIGIDKFDLILLIFLNFIIQGIKSDCNNLFCDYFPRFFDDKNVILAKKTILTSLMYYLFDKLGYVFICHMNEICR